ncbi:hypothetical protein GTY65_37225 [Streptomyces sp. SID8379]|nr:hypothetical protein [Streptomyces sp. SID8379]
MTAPWRLRDIEVRHPALQGAKSPMQTIGIKPSSSGGSGDGPADTPADRDTWYLLAGAGVVAGGAGLVLALAHADSPLRGPLALFFLLAAPGSAFAAALRGFDPWARFLVSAAGAVCVVMGVAQGMLATHRWSVDGGVIAVGALSALTFLLHLTIRKGRGKLRQWYGS